MFALKLHGKVSKWQLGRVAEQFFNEAGCNWLLIFIFFVCYFRTLMDRLNHRSAVAAMGNCAIKFSLHSREEPARVYVTFKNGDEHVFGDVRSVSEMSFVCGGYAINILKRHFSDIRFKCWWDLLQDTSSHFHFLCMYFLWSCQWAYYHRSCSVQKLKWNRPNDREFEINFLQVMLSSWSKRLIGLPSYESG